MNWSDWLGLSPQRFERRLQRRLAKPIGHNDFIALYNELIDLAARRPREVAALSTLIASLLGKRALIQDALLFWELKARSSAVSGDLDGTFDALRQMTDLDAGSSTREIVLELAEAAAGNPDSFGFSLDQRPRVLAAASEVFQRYGLLEQVAQMHLQAASLYSRHGASQAAYRSVRDAENIALEAGSPRLLAEVYGAAASTACEEGDARWAVGAAEQALSIWESIGEAPPAALLSNLGVAQMRLNRHKDAAANLRAALAAAIEVSLVSVIQANLAACLRAEGDLDGAWNAAREALKGLVDDSDPERRLELALVMARIASERQETSDLIGNLTEASLLLDLVLDNILRLHHRRGVRERYVPRIEGLLREFPSAGVVDQVLRPIAAVRSNALGDWLSILDWADAVGADTAINLSDKTMVVAAISALRNFGAPHLFGYREKYDDAWSLMNGGNAWDDLSTLAARIKGAGLGQPTSKAKLESAVERCRRRLEEGHCLMALTYAGHSAILWCLIGNRYVNTHLSLEALAKWKDAVRAHASDEINRTEFNARIGAVLDEIEVSVEPLLNSVADSGARSIRFIQDFADSLPLTALAMRHGVLAARMAAGEFHVRIVPALHEANETELSTPSVVAVTEPSEDLLLPSIEGGTFARAVGASKIWQVNAADKGDFPKILGHADVVLISTHSLSIQIYTDPYFARMGSPEGRHLISVESLQMFAPDLRASLVLLNACHSGSGSARNFQHSFRTSDLVTYPALFTLNRRATISAGAWKTSDTVAYLHTRMVADALLAGFKPSYAIGVSIGRLPLLTRSQAIELLDGIPDLAVREAAIARLTGAPERGLFGQPYVSGGIAVHGLL